jgi:threonine dehydrogenase-like Zn-dependent dehydrogenase
LSLVPAAYSIHEIDLDTSFVYTPEEVQMYLEMLDAGKISFGNMVTDIISLDDVVELGLGRKDRKGQIKILIDPSK